MNNQPNPSQSQAFGAPPPTASGASRLLPLMRTAATGGLLVALGLYGAQLLLPHDFKPSVVAGWAAGLTVSAEVEASREAKIDMDRRIADATAQANAKAQADLAAINKVLETRTEALETQKTLAGVADALCAGGLGVASLGAQNTGAGWHNGATALAQAACGVGNEMRADIARNQLDAVRAAAAARGMSMTDGAKPVPEAVPALPLAPVRPPPPPVQVMTAQPAEVATAQAEPIIKAPHGRWTAQQQGQLRLYSYGLPVDVLRQIGAGLDARQGFPEAWYDRVAAYQAAHRS